MITFRPTRDATRQQTKKRKKSRKARERKQTFWSKRNTDSICKHVDAFEDACAALVRKLNFLVSTAGENGAGSLRRSTTERARRAGGDVVHGVGMCGGGRKEKGEVGGEKEVGREKRKEGKKYAAKRPFMFVPLFGSGLCKNQEISHAVPSEHFVVYHLS
jgi:hypothetical protein